jgi:hypothetical protein
MNSVTVNRQVIEETRRRDPDACAREFDAEWADADTVLIPAAHIDRAMDSDEPWASNFDVLCRPYIEGADYVAAMDPATRGNAWTLVIATQYAETPMQRVVLAKQWVGSKVKPLDPDRVLREQTTILKDYHLDRCCTDQHAADALKAIARRHGLYLYDKASTREENVDLFESMATKFADGEVELPPVPLLRNDLLGIRKKVSSRISIALLKTPDGRHCDFAPSLARVLSIPLRLPVAPRPKPGTPEYYTMLRAEEKEAARQQAAKLGQEEVREDNKAARRGDVKHFVDKYNDD